MLFHLAKEQYRIVPGEDSGIDDAVDDDAEVSIDEEETGVEVELEEE
jgi:hypothetical protein